MTSLVRKPSFKMTVFMNDMLSGCLNLDDIVCSPVSYEMAGNAMRRGALDSIS
ncbi:hypothetical protein Plhal304r1_c036g0111381 [Plasmopara halstedii]